jgi:phenylpropionate dioxygenase-like ring-hydroxylating dioxygenase large terminal subunit
MAPLAPDGDRLALPRAYWYLACESRDLGRRPLRRSVLATPLVLFRAGAGEPAALLDRCAHRNLPLSEGRVVGEHIECAYHGWRYDRRGQCREVPALVAPNELKGRTVQAFPAMEQQGLVWVYMDPERGPTTPPFSFPHVGARGYGLIRFRAEVQATLHATLENMLDVPHTAFLHRGLFRGGPRHKITAIVRRFADRAEAEYVGEPRPSGLAGRLLAPRGGAVVHFDRFVLPSIAQVEYRLGRSHIVVTNALTPVDAFTTRFVSLTSFRLPAPTLLIRALLAPLAHHIFRQDARILRLQTETVRRFGKESYSSTDADLLGPHIWGLLKRAAQSEPPEAVAEPEIERRIELYV